MHAIAILPEKKKSLYADIEVRYRCLHERRELRLRQIADSRSAYYRQCVTCGHLAINDEQARAESGKVRAAGLNRYGVRAIYRFELSRFRRTLWQSLVTPVITTSLYFIVFGTAIGGRMGHIEGITYGAFIVPGLIMLSLFTESLSNASFGIYLPRFTGTIYEVLSAPLSAFEIVLAYVGAATTKSLILGLVILATASLFVPIHVLHPLWMVAFLLLIAATFSLAGFMIGIWANGFEQLQLIPMLIITPLTFLGGAFYSIDMLPPMWRTFSLINPIVYVVSGFRWTFYGTSDIDVALSVGMILAFFVACLAVVWWIFRTGYRLKS